VVRQLPALVGADVKHAGEALAVAFVTGFAVAVALHLPPLLRLFRQIRELRRMQEHLEAGVTPIGLEAALSKPRLRRPN
jgi:hypothetical protein